MTANLAIVLTALLFTLERVRVAMLGLCAVVLVKTAFLLWGLS